MVLILGDASLNSVNGPNGTVNRKRKPWRRLKREREGEEEEEEVAAHVYM